MVCLSFPRIIASNNNIPLQDKVYNRFAIPIIMESGHFDNLKNNNIISLVLDKSNVGKLEHLLAAGSESLTRLKSGFYPIYKGKRIKNKELSDVFNDVKVCVDSFLDTHGIEPCRCLYNNLYNLPRNIAYSLMNPSFAGKACIGAYFGSLILTQFIKIPGINLATLLPFLGIPFMFHFFDSLLAIDLGSIYYKKSILLKNGPPFMLIPAIAHEYVHHIQSNMLDLPPQSYCILKEGHARGVERHIAQL